MPKRIAVIDDDPDIVQIVKTTLKIKDYEVVTAPDGEDGLRLIQSTSPDLVILDLMMPKVSGLEVCRRLREDPKTRSIPIIVISAIGEKSDKPEEFWRMGLGAEDFISKPFNPQHLLGRVESVLRRDEYVSSRSNGGGKGEGAQRAPRPSLDKASPSEVVRCFIESWNSQSFGDEWSCMADSMRGGINREEYISRRQQAFAGEAATAPREQRVAEVVSEEITGDTAVVTVQREDKAGARTLRRREQYSLKQNKDGWKIVTVRVLSK
jgi:CheY-like chemotaxis protein